MSADYAGDWIQLARHHHAQQQYVPAAVAIERALLLAPRAVKLWDMAGDLYHALSRTNFTYVARAIECCQNSLALQPPGVASTLNNLAAVLTESGRYDEAIEATERAIGLDPSFYQHYQHAETLLSAKRYSAAQAAFRGLLARADFNRENTLRRADVYNHLAVSLLEGARIAGGMDEAVRRDALEASRAAIRLQPACPYHHAHNYYQILAASYLHSGRVDLASAALWPVAATLWGGNNDGGTYARAGFRALAWAQSRGGGDGAAAAAAATLDELRALSPGSRPSYADRLWTLEGFKYVLSATWTLDTGPWALDPGP